MAIEPISFKKLLKKTDDIYESVAVVSKRAKQILQERVLKQIIEENTELSEEEGVLSCLLYTSPSPRDRQKSRMPSSA